MNSYNQYNNGQNGTYSDQDRRDANRRAQDEDYNSNREDRDRQYSTDRDQQYHGQYSDRDRNNNYNQLPQGDRDLGNMSAAERSGFRAGLAAGHTDRQSGRGFSPNVSRQNGYSGQGQDRQLYRQGFREGYQRGYYGESRNTENGQYPQ